VSDGGTSPRRGLSVLRARSVAERLTPTQATGSELPPEPDPPELPDEIAAVLQVLPGAVLVVAADGEVVLATRPTRELRLLRHDRLQVQELLELVRAVAADGLARDVNVQAGWRGRIRPDGAGRSLAGSARALPVTGPRPLVLLLVEDRTEALRVEAARQDFVVNVSHELKTPVGAISLLAEAMQAAADDPAAVTRFAHRMQSETERLATLVGEIVELSRLQLHDSGESVAQLGVAELVGSAFDRCRVDAEAKRIELVSHVPRELLVAGNRNDLISALGNLVANALAYSPSHTRVTVTAVQLPADAHGLTMVEIAVADQGIGIPADKLDRIFERFYRLDEARSRATGGTGLGLAIVKHIATGHGGSVRVWSVRGAGSTFTLGLPAPERVPGAPASSGDPDRAGNPASSGTRNRVRPVGQR